MRNSYGVAGVPKNILVIDPCVLDNGFNVMRPLRTPAFKNLNTTTHGLMLGQAHVIMVTIGILAVP